MSVARSFGLYYILQRRAELRERQHSDMSTACSQRSLQISKPYAVAMLITSEQDDRSMGIGEHIVGEIARCGLRLGH